MSPPRLNSTLSVRIEELNAQISALHVENLRLRASEIALGSQLKKEREKSQRIMTDAESAVRFHPFPDPPILHVERRTRLPLYYWSSFSQRWPCVGCGRVGRLRLLVVQHPISSTTIPDHEASQQFLH